MRYTLAGKVGKLGPDRHCYYSDKAVREGCFRMRRLEKLNWTDVSAMLQHD